MTTSCWKCCYCSNRSLVGLPVEPASFPMTVSAVREPWPVVRHLASRFVAREPIAFQARRSVASMRQSAKRWTYRCSCCLSDLLHRATRSSRPFCCRRNVILRPASLLSLWACPGRISMCRGVKLGKSKLAANCLYHAGPIARFGLPEQPHRRIPGCLLHIELPAPLRRMP